MPDRTHSIWEMNLEKNDFWTLIDASRLAADHDPEAQVDTLEGLLAELEADQIVEFDRLMVEHVNRAYHWDLWAAAYIIGGGCSDDGFMDFTGWLIGKGEQVYEAALRDADSLADVVGEADDECQVEGMLYAPGKAWEEKTGRSGDDFPRHMFAFQDGPHGESWDEDAVDARLPRLAAMFSE
ncbi:DUF4240 domain-containing protein [Massilia sp. CCM 8692]|uniref:DUF4240 domain-containing protein n=1 Tax=Massilia rubra TaxID=2607910 RepID=A0ABX0LVM1_9BURK|nr:DUF4240 domain-containing protein [Massilia rubra]